MLHIFNLCVVKFIVYFHKQNIDILVESLKQKIHGGHMKKYVLLVVLMICMISCSGYYMTQKPQALIGSWQRIIKDNKTEFAARLTFNEDQTFSYVVEDPILGHVNTYGDVSIMFKKIAFLSDLQCKNAGIYKFSIEDNNTLIFTPERDLCNTRKSIINGAWTRLK